LPGDSDGKPHCGEEELWQMDYAVDAVLTADRALFKLFNLLEIRPHVIVGHSSGEIMALEAAGAVELSGEQERMQYILAGYNMIQRFAAVEAIPEAPLVAVGVGDRTVIYDIVQKSPGKLFIAMDNCPNQAVICCDKEIVDEVMDQLRDAGAICQILPFARPYHTPLFEPACKSLEEFFGGLKIVSPKVEIFSCMTAQPMPSNPKEVRELAVRQWAQKVRFQETVESMYDAGVRLFVEVGPKSNLTSFVNDILRGKPHLAVASNVHHRSSITQLNQALGLLVAHGIPMHLDYLYKRRMPRELNLKKAKTTRYDQEHRKSDVTLSLALPTLSLRTEEVIGSEAGQEEQIFPKSSERAELGNRPSIPSMRSAAPSDQDNRSVKRKAVDEPYSASPREDDTAFRPTSLKAHVIQEYLRTMESFLDLQQRVMETYLAQEDSAKTAMSQSQTSHLQVSEEAADATESAFPDRDVSDGSPADLNAGPTESIRESGALPGSRSTAVLDKESIERLLLSCISEKTGYPVDMLSLNQNLEADLGIDSIKRVEILGALFKQIGPLEEGEIEQLNALKTLQEIVDFLPGDNEGRVQVCYP